MINYKMPIKNKFCKLDDNIDNLKKTSICNKSSNKATPRMNKKINPFP